MPLKILPVGNRLIVKPVEDDTPQLLIIPESAKEKPQKALVIEVGPGEAGRPLIAKVGDHVFYRRNSGIPLPDGYYPDHTGLFIMTEGTDTLMVISEQ